MDFDDFARQNRAEGERCDPGHRALAEALGAAPAMRQSLVLAPPHTGRTTLATVLFPAWLVRERGAGRVVVVCATVAQARESQSAFRDRFPEEDCGLSDGVDYAAPRVLFAGAHSPLSGVGADAFVFEPPSGGDPRALGYYTGTLLSRCAPGGFVVTVHQLDLADALRHNREGADDLALRLMRSGVPTTHVLPHAFAWESPPPLADSDDYRWRYLQGLG